jgi:hypothetical protein
MNRSRFTGAIRAQKSKHFACFHRQGEILESVHCGTPKMAIVLTDVKEL